MKKALIVAIFLVLGLTGCSSHDSGEGRYKLFKTRNMWTFLKLDTQTGMIWQVQFSTKGDEYRYQTELSLVDLVNDLNRFDGRFTLYQTENIYNFVLLDQYDGRAWQVQWGEPANRAVMPIR